MQRSSLKLLAPLLILLVPLALLVLMGTQYVRLKEVERERNLQEQAKLLLAGQESEISRRIMETATRAIETMLRGGAPPPPGSNSATYLQAGRQAEQVPYIQGIFDFLGDESGESSDLLTYPEPLQRSVLGLPYAQFPFEVLGDDRVNRRFQEQWQQVSARVDSCLLAGSYNWAYEAIAKAGKASLGRNPAGRAYLDHLNATVLRHQGRREEARKALLELAGWLGEMKIPWREPRALLPPQREILLVKFEAACLAPDKEKRKELLRLAEEIVGDTWRHVPEEFLKFIFHQKLVPTLQEMGDPEVDQILLEEILPAQDRWVQRRAFFDFMYRGMVDIRDTLAQGQRDQGQNIQFIDTTMGDKTLILAFRVLEIGQRDRVVGAAIDLEPLAFDHLHKDPDWVTDDQGDRLQVSFNNPYNLPVLTHLTGSISNSPPLAIRSLQAPLLGFRLQAVLENPEATRERLARDMRVLWVYLAALGLMAGGGAFFLLRNVRRELEVARMKSDFVSRVTHDLKTPLALIRLYAETLALGRADADDKATQCGRVITNECDMLTGMIERVLTFSRIERGMLTYTMKPGRLDQETDKILDLFAPEARYKKIDLDREIGLVPQFSFDREGFRRALLNLLDNAAKFGGGSARVCLEAVEGMARLEVMDRGQGISEEELKLVFEPFHRGRGAGEKRGSGLGLSLVKHFATAHGGSIQVIPRDGGGTIMRLNLPMDR